MIRSLYSGVSGLTTHQTRMDVIGNNIANVNTYGYKTMRATFRDIYYQAAKSASSGKAAYAGNNVSEVGYGVRLGSIDKDMSPSSGQSTGKNWDMMIESDGFFITATFDGTNVRSDLRTREALYTRMGNFGPDSYGNLATADNRFVLGSRNSLDGLKNTGSLSENSLDDVQLKDRNDDGQINASDLSFRNTINLNELIQTAYNVYTDDFGFMYGINWEALLALEEGPADGTYVAYDFDGADWPADVTSPADKMKYVDVQQTLLNLGVYGGDDDARTKFETFLTANADANIFYAVDKTGEALTLRNAAGETTTYAEQHAALLAAEAADNAQTDPTQRTALKTAKATAETFTMTQGELTYSDVGTINVTSKGQLICNYNGDMKYLARIELACFDNVDGLGEAGGTNFQETAASGAARIKNPDTEGAGPI
ncbi:MAG: flagellar hook-basal body complex protein, partial [Oscillospiraceae bacterium]|nr:flagellar hook-basal body complex protein [Oscillospiraceae bacterium]